VIRTRRLAGLVLLVLAACGGSRGTIEGVVIEVDGDLTEVTSFVVVTEEGERLAFTPAPDLAFHDGAPLAHLMEHVRTGQPIRIRYTIAEDGDLVARALDDR
jgi:hypothetical protein